MNRVGSRAFAAICLLASLGAAFAIYKIGGWKLLAAWLLW